MVSLLNLNLFFLQNRSQMKLLIIFIFACVWFTQGETKNGKIVIIYLRFNLLTFSLAYNPMDDSVEISTEKSNFITDLIAAIFKAIVDFTGSIAKTIGNIFPSNTVKVKILDQEIIETYVSYLRSFYIEYFFVFSERSKTQGIRSQILSRNIWVTVLLKRVKILKRTFIWQPLYYNSRNNFLFWMIQKENHSCRKFQALNSKFYMQCQLFQKKV